MTARPWTIRLNGKDIGTIRYASPTLGMPVWCNNVCYLVKGVQYRQHVITVEEHPGNGG